MRKAVFLDRDGVINENRHDYVKAWEEVRFLPGALDALARLADTDFSIVIVTNQSAIGRGIVTAGQVEIINHRLAREIALHGGRIDATYYCPHGPADRCECRKPKPGLLLRAAREMRIDMPSSYLVGDAVIDVEAALNAGVQPVMVRTGRGTSQELLLKEKWSDIHVVMDLPEAVTWILHDEKRKRSAQSSL